MIENDIEELLRLRPIEELHEDHGFVLLWHVPICEPPVVDSLTGDTFWDGGDGWYTHFSLLPHAVSENKLQLVKNKDKA